ncbi:glycine zipper 2TM domain-containing protein [Vibrio sp. CAU 1672]|uniref:glycine zipper 2TM domain-containing protein n=1 Tax=Vibrio sp. CAU 1672 TaxID=3032594 RepID=UPI0023D9F3AB|nr:glycine zipper 2TM domain-containing protein [Vibrio sp. CAU 1672]MDF2152997.1 glycine zipper 2TM domain-containing protein [Vibrio sp. CAU 1672]
MKIKSIAMAMSAVVLLAGCQEETPPPTKAYITVVEAVTEEVQRPHQVCEDVLVTHQVAPKDENKLLGTIGGAAAGAALGNQIGGGSGKVIATAAGTIAGALAGREIQDNVQKGDVVTSTETQCHTEYVASQQVVGYDVTYEIAGVPTTVHLEDKPEGHTFPIQDGQVILP